MAQVQRSPTKMGWESFPNSLCYGFLDAHSKRIIDDYYVADYLMNGKKVMEVRMNHKHAKIEEYWDGYYLGMSCYPDLKKTVCNHFSLLDQRKSPIHKAWAYSIAALGNVYVEFIDPAHVKHIVYPGVFMHDIYIPVRLEDTITIDEILSNQVVKPFDSKLLHSVLTWKEKSSGKVIQEEIFLLKIQTPIAAIYDIIKSIHSCLYKEKMWRGVIILHQDCTGIVRTKDFTGTEKDDYTYYSLILP